ncbi:MAG: chaplin family protein [Stackebrandtia sp.]
MTKRIMRHASVAGAVAAGAVLLFGGAAQAAGPDIISAGNHGIANGNQVVLPIQAPIDVCGNAVAVAGVAGAGCTGGSSANLEAGKPVLGDMVTAGNNGIGNGNQVQAPIQAPINVCGNAVAVAGAAGAGCKGGSDANMGGGHHGDHHAKKKNNWKPAADQSMQQASKPVAAKGSESTETTKGGDKSVLGDMVSAGNNGILNGNQVQAPIQVPIDVSGNAVGVLGVAGAGSTGGSAANMG